MAGEPAQVECYSGHSYAQEPRAFAWRGERRLVAAVERIWRTPAGLHFIVRTQDGARLELAYHEQSDEWALNVLGQEPYMTRDLDKEVKNNA